MRFHLLALPNAQTTRAYSLDGFAMATMRFAKMMKDLGHTVFLYASEENEAPCDELITVITKEEQDTLLGSFSGRPNSATEYQHAWIDERSPLWQLANPRTIAAIAKRKQPRDFICGIGGSSQEAIAIAHSDLMFVEYSIGYTGSFSPYRVFESQIWRHRTYGNQNIEDGRFFDEVIPVFFDPDEFPFQQEKEPFVLYCGRLIERKGVGIACRAAAEAGVPLKIIGPGNKALVTHDAEYLGAPDYQVRNRLMCRAQAVLCPTQYVEPFCCVGIEAQMCGTPVISTDFGAFIETVEQGRTGFRCRYLGEFVKAIKDSANLKPDYIRARAVANYSMDVIKYQYQKYFERLLILWDKGWDTLSV